jgi:tetratricopeptide (TPR) repeat protein
MRLRKILPSFLLACLLCPLSFSQTGASLQSQLEAHGRSAQQYLREGKPDLAIPELKAVLALDPNNVDARGNLGVLLYFRGDYAGAIPELRAALKLKPGLCKIQALLGFSEMRHGEDDAGRRDLEAAFPHLDEEKIKADAANDLIASYSATGELDKAAAVVSEMLKLRPSDAGLLYTQYRLNADLANQAMLTLAVVSPNGPQMRRVIEHEFAAHQAMAAGVSDSQKEISRDPEVLDPELDAAAAKVSFALKQHPTDAATLGEAYRVYSELSERARAMLQTKAPESAEAYRARAHELAKQGYPGEAIASFRQALKLNAGLLDLRFELAEQLSTSSDPALQAEAEQEYKAALADDPTNEKAEARLGEIAAKNGDQKTAYADFSRALELQPNDPEANIDISRALEAMGEGAKALPFAERAAQLDPTNAEAHYRLGMLDRAAGKTEEMRREIAQFKKYKALKDNLSETLRRLKAQVAEESQKQDNAQGTAKTEALRAQHAGDAACLSCHKDESETYLHTGHHLTSQLPSAQSILGSFVDGSNTLVIRDARSGTGAEPLSLKMESKQGSYYESAIAGRGSKQKTRTERIDVVVGSGAYGQSYLFWQGDALFELPVSYWSASRQWINSPGYEDGTANFSRPITPRCLECHATAIEPLSPDPATNRYRKDSFVPGISCETCHGPGAEHIARQSGSAGAGKAQAILNPAAWTRDRQVDLCALCHNGTQREEIAPAFSYVPGEDLDKYLAPGLKNTVEHPDVHGNEVGLLKRSRCYISSTKMSCSTCHDVHAPERPAESYAKQCLTCHTTENCGMRKTLGEAIATRCVSCHMPEEKTTLIFSETAHTMVRATMRNHWIKVYPEAQSAAVTATIPAERQTE